MKLGEWREKAWGRVRTIALDNQHQIDECEIVAGGFSSRHLHADKINSFFVLSGLLLIHQYDINGHLLPGVVLPPRAGCIEIAAGVQHRFEAMEQTRLLEVYTRGCREPLLFDDIVRFDEGGVKK